MIRTDCRETSASPTRQTNGLQASGLQAGHLDHYVQVRTGW